jgi:hypothetical protein
MRAVGRSSEDVGPWVPQNMANTLADVDSKECPRTPRPNAGGRVTLRRASWILALSALFALVGVPAANATTSAVWQLRSSQPGVLTGYERLRVVELFRNQALTYGERSQGINLVWGSPEENNAYFVGRTPRRPLRYGEHLAFHVRDGGFVKYLVRDHGINLGWSSTPRYEWILYGRNKARGSFVRSGDRVALYNMPNHKYVVYGERDEGINLVWSRASPNSPTEASVRVSVRIGPFDGAGVACTGAVTWDLAPAGGFFEFDGRTTPVNSIQSFSAVSALSNAPPSGYYCTVSWQFFGLRPAVWKTTPKLSSGWQAGGCFATLNPGENRANFSAGRPSGAAGSSFCTQDSSFPPVSQAVQ